MQRLAQIKEAVILEKLIVPSVAKLTPAAARSLLALRFDSRTTRQINKVIPREPCTL
jgi:hypothetical protein